MNSLTQTELLRALPYARRFARAVTSDRDRGDDLVAQVLTDPLPDLPPRLALYAAIARAAPLPTPHGGLTPTQRQMLLLTALEDLTIGEAARVLGLTEQAAMDETVAARGALRVATATDVLVIEDEPIIALDLKRLVEACGHRVVGVAPSEAEAVRLAAATRPGLILADINLGRGGDGSVAVSRIQRVMTVPVIFVTAYPERLLTAKGLEPAFVISKPFVPLALAIATYQAVHGGRAPLI